MPRLAARHRSLLAALRVTRITRSLLDERFARTFASSPIPMCISELATGQLIDVNPAFLAVSGYSRQELLGKSTLDFGVWNSPEQRAQVVQTLQQQGSIPGALWAMPLDLTTKHAAIVPGALWALLSFQVVNHAGQDRWLTSCLDVTHKVEAGYPLGDALRASESKYRTLVEQASDGIILSGPHGKSLDANPAACQMLGYTRDELLALSIEDITEPLDLERTPIHYEQLRAGQHVMLERAMRRKDGSTFTAEISARMLPDGNIQAIIRDITQRKRVEDELRVHAELLDQVQASVIAVDIHGRITHWNRHAEVLYGWSRDEVLGSVASEIIVGELDARAAADIVAEVQANGQWEGEFRVRRRDGSSFPAYVIDTTMRNDQGEPIGIVGVSVDITDRKADEQKIRQHAVSQTQLLRRLIYAEEAERRRLSLEIHDGPLQSLGVALMAVDRALRRYERGEADLALREMQFVRTNLASTVGEIRAVLADLSQEVLTTYGLATALAGHIERFIDVTGIEIEMSNNVTRRLPADIELLVYRLAQEAMSNIRKHSGARSAKLSLQILGNTLYLKISDDGNGFDVESVLSRYEDGKHLGLKSMRERVQAAGGDLAIASSPGKGTLIEFRCPVPPREQTLTLLSEEDLISGL